LQIHLLEKKTKKKETKKKRNQKKEKQNRVTEAVVVLGQKQKPFFYFIISCSFLHFIKIEF